MRRIENDYCIYTIGFFLGVSTSSDQTGLQKFGILQMKYSRLSAEIRKVKVLVTILWTKPCPFYVCIGMTHKYRGTQFQSHSHHCHFFDTSIHPREFQGKKCSYSKYISIFLKKKKDWCAISFIRSYLFS